MLPSGVELALLGGAELALLGGVGLALLGAPELAVLEGPALTLLEGAAPKAAAFALRGPSLAAIESMAFAIRFNNTCCSWI